MTSRHGKLFVYRVCWYGRRPVLGGVHTQATAFEPCHARMLHHQEAHLTSLTTHHYISLSLSVSLYPSTLLLIVWHMNSYDTLLVISHLRKLGTQPSALLHSSLGRLPVPSASLGLPGLCRVWIKDVQRLILTHFDPHLECLATKEFDGSSLHGNPKWPGSTVIWQYWNHACRHTRMSKIFVCNDLSWILYKSIYVLTAGCCFSSDLPHHIKRISWELPGCCPHQLKWFSSSND